MEPRPNNSTKDRRADNDLRELIDKKVAELDDRREKNLQYKLAAVEKLFNKTIETKAEALTIAVSRIQGEGTACARRCREQVNAFYKSINEMAANIIRVEMIIETLTKEGIVSENDVKAVNERVDTVNKEMIERGIRITDLMKFKDDKEESDSKIEERIQALELWKSLDFKRSIIITIVAIVTAIQVAVWLKEKLFPSGV